MTKATKVLPSAAPEGEQPPVDTAPTPQAPPQEPRLSLSTFLETAHPPLTAAQKAVLAPMTEQKLTAADWRKAATKELKREVTA